MSAEVLARIEAKLDQLLAQTAPKRPGDDEKIFRDPKEKYWQGESYEGCKLSEAPADYLRALARYKGACAWANRKEGDPAKAKYADKDEATAKLATAWAEYREATGEVVEPAPTGRPTSLPSDDLGPPPSNDEIPF